MVECGAVKGLTLQHCEKKKVGGAEGCRICLKANLKKADVPRFGQRLITRPLQVVGTDLQTIDTKSYDGKKYFVLYVDQKSGIVATIALQNKSDQAEAAERVLPRLETLANDRIDTVRADLGGEYTSKRFQQFVESTGRKLEYSDTDMPFQNGLAETTGGKLLRMMRASRLQSNVPKRYWTENLSQQTWIANRVPMKKQNGLTTPWKVMTGETPDLSRLRPYGCECWVLIRDTKKLKLDARAEMGVHLGVSQQKKAWRVLLWSSRKIIESRNVAFVTQSFPFAGGEGTAQKKRSEHGTKALELLLTKDDDGDDNDDGDDSDDGPDTDDAEDDASNDEDGGAQGEDGGAEDDDEKKAEAQPRRSKRIRSRPLRYGFDDDPETVDAGETTSGDEAEADDKRLAALVTLAIANAHADELPKNEAEAQCDPNWRAAEEREMEALAANDFGDRVPRPEKEQVLPTRMVYKVKESDKAGERLHKARFVVKGCCDKNKAEKNTFAPTLKYSSFRLLLALAAMLGASLFHLDIKAAFTNGELPYPVYVEQPAYHAKGDPNKFVIKLKKSLYGLAESPRLWNQKLDSELTTMGFRRLESDPCVYVMNKTREKGSKKRRHIAILGAFVDDLFLFGTDKCEADRVKTRLKQVFKTTDLGRARWALGMAIRQDQNSCITLDQRKYLDDVLSRFAEFVEDKKKNPLIPLPTDQKMRRTTEDQDAIEEPYRELVGSLMYLAIGTRSDIQFAVSLLSRYLSKPSAQHWNAGTHVLRYLRGTRNLAIRYVKKSELADGISDEWLSELNTSLHGHVDSDFASDVDTSRSVTGQVFLCSGGPVSWRSKQQSIVTTSTCHAEYVAACEAARECVWMREFIQELGLDLTSPTTIREDNEAALFLSDNPASTERSKHIRVKWHYLRQCARDGTLKLVKVDSKDNAADVLTKPCSSTTLKMFTSTLGLTEIDEDRAVSDDTARS